MSNRDTLIAERFEEIEKLNSLLEYVQHLGVRPETLSELKAKISSRIAQCEISIRDLNLHPENYKQ